MPFIRGLELDGDAPLPLEIHVVQELLLHIPVGHGAVSCNKRSARVDLPWSMGTMQKLRIRETGASVMQRWFPVSGL